MPSVNRCTKLKDVGTPSGTFISYSSLNRLRRLRVPRRLTHLVGSVHQSLTCATFRKTQLQITVIQVKCTTTLFTVRCAGNKCREDGNTPVFYEGKCRFVFRRVYLLMLSEGFPSCFWHLKDQVFHSGHVRFLRNIS
jgi:hypothetical protein